MRKQPEMERLWALLPAAVVGIVALLFFAGAAVYLPKMDRDKRSVPVPTKLLPVGVVELYPERESYKYLAWHGNFSVQAEIFRAGGRIFNARLTRTDGGPGYPTGLLRPATQEEELVWRTVYNIYR